MSVRLGLARCRSCRRRRVWCRRRCRSRPGRASTKAGHRVAPLQSWSIPSSGISAHPGRPCRPRRRSRCPTSTPTGAVSQLPSVGQHRRRAAEAVLVAVDEAGHGVEAVAVLVDAVVGDLGCTGVDRARPLSSQSVSDVVDSDCAGVAAAVVGLAPLSRRRSRSRPGLHRRSR